MIKHTVLSAIALAQYALAFELDEFMNGLISGSELTLNTHLSSLSHNTECLEPTFDSALEQTLVMNESLQSFLSAVPSLKLAFDDVFTFGKLAAILTETYDGGDFCQGLLLARNLPTLAMGIVAHHQPGHNDAITEDKSPKQEDHLIERFLKDSGKRTMVVGHRGGFFGPENSMKGFRGAIENNLEGIEFDVWLSADNVPMVIHGGSDGNLNIYSDEGRVKYVVEHAALENIEKMFKLIDTNGDKKIDMQEIEMHN